MSSWGPLVKDLFSDNLKIAERLAQGNEAFLKQIDELLKKSLQPVLPDKPETLVEKIESLNKLLIRGNRYARANVDKLLNIFHHLVRLTRIALELKEEKDLTYLNDELNNIIMKIIQRAYPDIANKAFTILGINFCPGWPGRIVHHQIFSQNLKGRFKIIRISKLY